MQTKETVTITKVFTKEEISKRTGKPYTKMAIKTNEFGDKWISGFKGKENANWAEGMKVDILLEKKGEYLNFSVPKLEDKVKFEMDGIQIQLGHMKYILERIAEKVGVAATAVKPTIGDTGMDYPMDAIDTDDIPF